MLMGIKLQAHPTEQQKLILSEWMGCGRFIWNAKCDEERYYSSFARKYCPIDTYAPLDQTYSQFKDDNLSPWLAKCPSQILRNSAVNWFETFNKFIKGGCGKPKRKKKTDGGSIHLTKELFRFELCQDGVTRLFIGAKRNNIGYLSIKNHGTYQPPNSIYIKKRHGEYWVSFCYEDSLDESQLSEQKDHLKYLKDCAEDFLKQHVVGIDRGVVRPIQAGQAVFDFTPEQKRKKSAKEKYVKRQQKRLARQQIGSNRRYKTKKKIAKAHQKIANIRKDLCHKTSHALVISKEHKVFILEDLKTKNMTKRPKAKPTEKGSFAKNGAHAKAGLNRVILDKGWHQFETFLKYKAYRAGKAWFKISAHHTSQECAACSHTHPDNRKSQELFSCENCGHTDNADHNAAEVIKKRAIRFILDSGTELSKRGLLSDSGRGAKVRHEKQKATHAVAAKRQKTREQQEVTLHA